MKIKLCLLALFATTAPAAWVVENVPTTLDSSVAIGTEFSAAYRPVYDSNGVKISEDMMVAYRSLKMRVAVRSGLYWTQMTFADNGRYPYVTIDAQGRRHMTFFETNLNKLFYAHPVPAGTGNCGPQTTWACEEVPGSLWGSPKGRSAVVVVGNTVNIVYEAPWTSPGSSILIHYTKTIGSSGWASGPYEAAAAYTLRQLSLRADSSGTVHLLTVETDASYWYKRTQPNVWHSVGPMIGAAALAVTSAGAPRLCYRDYGADQLMYTRSDGTTSWQSTTIDYDSGSTGNCSIAIPPDIGTQLIGYYNPRIAYFDAQSNALKYATLSPLVLNNPTWSVQTITAATGAKKIELALDRSAKAVVFYFDSSASSVRLARLQ